MANPLDTFLDKVDSATATFISDTTANIASTVGPVFTNLLILYFTLYGIGIWRGVITTDLRAFAFSIIKVAIIYGFVLITANYNAFIVDFLTNGPDALAGAILPTGGDPTDALGNAYEQSFAAADKAFEKSGWFMPYFLGLTILLVSTVLVIFAGFIIALAKIALSLLVAVGPIFILLLMFNSTSKMFQAWLQQCINFFLQVVFTIATLGLGAQLYIDSISVIPTDPDSIEVQSIVPIVLTSVILTLLLKQIPAFASAIAGGVQISTLGIESAVGRGISRLNARWSRGGGSGAGLPGFNRRNTIRKN